MEDSVREHFELDWRIRHLNHGSFGAVLKEVKRRQRTLQDQQERDPLGFYLTCYEPLLANSLAAMARFLGAQAEGLAFVPNATYGVNAVLRSLSFEPGDEVLYTSHGYAACNYALQEIAQRAGARAVRVELPLCVEDESQVVDAVLAQVTQATKLVMLDHVTSPTALVFPVKRLVELLHARGVEVLIDGAHAPGMLPLSLDELGADYYTGNGHKWMCAPRGAAFLYVAPQHRAKVRPAVLSHGAGLSQGHPERFRAEFDWIGTMDPSAWLVFGDVIEVMEEILGDEGWDALRAHNDALAAAGAQVLMDRLGLEPVGPRAMWGSMVSLKLWDDPDGAPSRLMYQSPTQAALMSRWSIEAMLPLWPKHPSRLIRLSAHLYNTLEDYEVLAQALEQLRESV